MSHKQFALTTAFLGGALLIAASARETTAADAPKTLQVGLVNTLYPEDTEKQIQSMAGPFKSLMEEQAGVIAEVFVSGDAEKLAAQMKEGKIQLGVFNGFEFAWAQQKNPDLKPLLVAVNQQPYTRAVLVVRADNKATDAAALRGKTLALPVLSNEQCRLFLARRCVGADMAPAKWFAKITTPRTPQDALDDLSENYVQATVVEDVDLAAFGKTYPKTAARLRVLLQSEKFPPAVIAYLPGKVNDETLKRLRTGMIESKKTERGRKLLDLCRITGFETIPDDFAKSLADILKAYPPPKK